MDNDICNTEIMKSIIPNCTKIIIINIFVI